MAASKRPACFSPFATSYASKLLNIVPRTMPWASTSINTNNGASVSSTVRPRLRGGWRGRGAGDGGVAVLK